MGIDTFDLREHEIDVSPWLPILLDGKLHKFEIRVVSLDDDGKGHAMLVNTSGSYWLVTGKIFLFLDEKGAVTRGGSINIATPPPLITISSTVMENVTGANETLTYSTAVSRQIFITSTIYTSNGAQVVSWSQNLSYTNRGIITDQGLTQSTAQSTRGADSSDSIYANIYNYPIVVNSSYNVSPSGALAINGSLLQGLDYNLYGSPIFPSGLQALDRLEIIGNYGFSTPRVQEMLRGLGTALLSTMLAATAKYYSAPNSSYSFGTTEQDFSFRGVAANASGSGYELYRRRVKAINSSIVEDSETLLGHSFGVPHTSHIIWLPRDGDMGNSARAMLGRGPGKSKICSED